MLRPALFLAFGLAAGAASAQSFDALRLASELRWMGNNCFALKLDYRAANEFMIRNGVSDRVFEPSNINAGYIDAQEKALDRDQRARGLTPVCRELRDKYAKAGVVRSMNPAELRELNTVRSDMGGSKVEPIE